MLRSVVRRGCEGLRRRLLLVRPGRLLGVLERLHGLGVHPAALVVVAVAVAVVHLDARCMRYTRTEFSKSAVWRIDEGLGLVELESPRGLVRKVSFGYYYTTQRQRN